ncbi:Uncharacterized protein Adt_42059 [Abeliophyllum distichum]|uniref:Uncharacterized protein n=1 Tax=Abeliophyllum distichum TaxID=126358 RepID=A0ABD1PS83_9LAMI
MDVPSIMKEEDLTRLREEYRIPEDIELILPGPNERACFPRRGCTSLASKRVRRSEWLESDGGGHVPCGSVIPSAWRCLFTSFNPYTSRGSCRGRRAKRRKLVGPLPRCELSRENIDVLRSIYEADSKGRSYNFILNRQRCLVELGLVASKAEMDQGRRPRPTLAKLAKQRPRTLVPGSAEDSSQRKVIEDLSRAGNKEAAEASKVIEVDDAPED